MLLREKVKLWRDRFFGRQEVFGYKKSFFSSKKGEMTSQYLPMYREKYRTKESRKGKTFNRPAELYIPLGDNHIESHIKGDMELLIYVLQTNHTANFLAIDFDLKHGFDDVLKTRDMFESHGMKCAIARSTKKGHHIYLFFDNEIEGKYLTSYINFVYEELGFMDKLRNDGTAPPEVFPKTIALRDAISPGYGIKPPMHLGGQARDQNCWVDDKDKPIGGKGTSEKQWDYFAEIPVNNVDEFKEYMHKTGITVEDIRMSEKRGAIAQTDYQRQTPYEVPEDGDLNLVVQGCPAMKRLWEGPSKDMSNEARVALMSWALQTKNGVDMLREKWNYSDETERQVTFAIETNQKPHSCRALQEHGVCVKGKDPKFSTSKYQDAAGTDLNDYCFTKVPPKEIVHGKLVSNPNNLPEEDWADPSPIRLRKPFKKETVKSLKDEIDLLDKEDVDLGEKVAVIYQKMVRLRDASQRKSVQDHLKTKKLAKVSELKEFEREAQEDRKLEKERELDRGDGILTVNGTRYTTLDSGGYATLNLDKEGNTIVVEISNFEIELERDIRMHTILAGDVKELVGYTLCQTIKYPFNIPTAEWNSNPKLASAIAQSAGAAASFRMINLDRIREAINSFGTRSMETENSFEDYGYDDDIEPGLFRSSTYNITSDGLVIDGDHVNLRSQDFAKGLGIEDISNEDFQRTIHIIKNDLFHLQNSIVTFTSIAHSLQASIHGPYIPVQDAPVLWIQGITGSGKSAMAKFAQSFHGFFPRLLNVNSTLRGIEFNSMLFKDALLVIDDYKEGFHRDGTIKLIQSFYDRSSRAKQRKDGSSAVGTSCRGLVMFTAEDRPTSEASALSRCIYVESPQVTSDSRENDERFKKIVSVEKLFPGVLGRFIHYVMKNYSNKEDLENRFWDYAGALKDGVRSRQNSHRIAQNLAANYLTWELFLDFIEAKGMLTREEKSLYLEEHWENVISLRDTLVKVCEKEQASHIFLETINSLVASGKCRMTGHPDSEDNSKGTNLGFMNDRLVYLNPTACMAEVKPYLEKGESSFSHGKGAVWNQLQNDGHIADSYGARKTVQRKFEGKRGVHMWCLHRNALIDDLRLVPKAESYLSDVDMTSF